MFGLRKKIINFCCALLTKVLVLNVMSLDLSLTLLHGVIGWSVVCDCGISCLYSLTFLSPPPPPPPLPVTSAAGHSKAVVVLLLFTWCLLYFCVEAL